LKSEKNIKYVFSNTASKHTGGRSLGAISFATLHWKWQRPWTSESSGGQDWAVEATS